MDKIDVMEMNVNQLVRRAEDLTEDENELYRAVERAHDAYMAAATKHKAVANEARLTRRLAQKLLGTSSPERRAKLRLSFSEKIQRARMAAEVVDKSESRNIVEKAIEDLGNVLQNASKNEKVAPEKVVIDVQAEPAT